MKQILANQIKLVNDLVSKIQTLDDAQKSVKSESDKIYTRLSELHELDFKYRSKSIKLSKELSIEKPKLKKLEGIWEDLEKNRYTEQMIDDYITELLTSTNRQAVIKKWEKKIPWNLVEILIGG